MIRKQRIIIVGIAGRRFAREPWGDPVDSPDFHCILIPHGVNHIPGNPIDPHLCYPPLKCDGPRALLHEEPMGTRSSKVLQSPATKQITDKDFIGIDYTAVKGKINSIYAKKNVYFIAVRPGDVYEGPADKDPNRVRVLYDAVNYKITHILHA